MGSHLTGQIKIKRGPKAFVETSSSKYFKLTSENSNFAMKIDNMPLLIWKLLQLFKPSIYITFKLLIIWILIIIYFQFNNDNNQYKFREVTGKNLHIWINLFIAPINKFAESQDPNGSDILQSMVVRNEKAFSQFLFIWLWLLRFASGLYLFVFNV